MEKLEQDPSIPKFLLSVLFGYGTDFVLINYFQVPIKHQVDTEDKYTNATIKVEHDCLQCQSNIKLVSKANEVNQHDIK